LKHPRCDACKWRLRENQHELHLTDPLTGQVIGRYHADPGSHAECMARAEKYFQPGEVVLLNVVHPDRCGPDQEHCDAGLSEAVA
jgi:hypothetical protein